MRQNSVDARYGKKIKEFTSSLKSEQRERKPYVGTRFICFALCIAFSINFAGFDAYLLHTLAHLLDWASVMETFREVFSYYGSSLFLF